MVIKEMCKTYSYSRIFQHILNSKKGLFWFFLSCVWSYMKSITREAVNNSSAQGNGWSIVQKSWNNSPPHPPPPSHWFGMWTSWLHSIHKQIESLKSIETTKWTLKKHTSSWMRCSCLLKTFVGIGSLHFHYLVLVHVRARSLLFLVQIPFSCIVIIIACIHILIETTKVLYDIKVRSLGRLLGGISGLVWWPGDWPFPLPSGLLLLGWGFAESGIWPYQYPLDFPFSKNYSG